MSEKPTISERDKAVHGFAEQVLGAIMSMGVAQRISPSLAIEAAGTALVNLALLTAKDGTELANLKRLRDYMNSWVDKAMEQVIEPGFQEFKRRAQNGELPADEGPRIV